MVLLQRVLIWQKLDNEVVAEEEAEDPSLPNLRRDEVTTVNSSFSGEGAGGAVAGPEEPVRTDIETQILPQNDGSVVLNYTQDVEPVLEAIKRGETRQWLSKEREMKAIAEIPIIVYAEWAKQHGMTYKQAMEDPAAMRRFLADPDQNVWRIGP